MESPSEAPQTGGSPWKRLLITASFLNCWIQPTCAQRVVPRPAHGTVGSSVILDIQGASEQPVSYGWIRRAPDYPSPLAFFVLDTGVQVSEDSRLKVFSNGSLLISNLTLNDTDDYLFFSFDQTNIPLAIAKGHLAVFAQESPGGGDGSSLSGGAIAGIVIGVLACTALSVALIYFLFFTKTGGASKENLSKNPSGPKNGEGAIAYENTVYLKDSALSAQGLSSSPAFPEVPSESAYQALDVSRVDVYEKIVPWKNP